MQKEFLVKIIKDENILFEGVIHIWAESKSSARKLFYKQFSRFRILSIKKWKVKQKFSSIEIH